MAFIHKQKKIIGKIIQKCGRRRSGLSALDHPGVIFNAIAKADLCKHFQIIIGSLRDSLSLDQLIILPKPSYLLIALLADLLHGTLQLFSRCHIMAGRIDRYIVNVSLHQTGYCVDLGDTIHLVAKKFHTDRPA